MQEEAGKSSSVKVELDSKDNAKTAPQKVAEKVADSAASKVVKDSGLTGDAASVANSMAQEALRTMVQTRNLTGLRSNRNFRRSVMT